MKLLTTDTHFSTAEGILDNLRAGSTKASFPVDAIRALVRDHVTLLEAARLPFAAVPEPGDDQRSLS